MRFVATCRYLAAARHLRGRTN